MLCIASYVDFDVSNCVEKQLSCKYMYYVCVGYRMLSAAQ